MPHVIVKLWPGKTDAQKRELAEAITSDVTRILGYGEVSVSVGFEEVAPQDWNDKVVDPDILGKWHKLGKQPGYVSPDDAQR
ncbi:tautomerase family protein [Stakelama tenebrarum]|uniref:4-oxalocrotonate tautomerase n=1 Tax=Stakelama tenebrarum TaxID=2711215 RepID=A0A6G6Y4G5_9SPHN|nr:tautomerase family protein [Sphingosinithalassobacter tenebrarum]QIG79822.1 4-oxalocrotonate tautomerase [Sphingosinithalassobacter tenebrarum]